MSGESKKKRGEAGKSNAKNIAFRYGGSKCDFSTNLGRTTHPRLGGSKFLNAMKLGVMIGNADDMSDRMVKAADENMDRCPSVTEDRPSNRSSNVNRGHKTDGRLAVRFGSNCDLTVNGETVDLSSAFGFKTVGTGKNAIHGLLRPTKDNDRASSMIIAALQDRGMFKSSASAKTKKEAST